MYNPFKPHLCQFNNGTYGIRKLSALFWIYLDADDYRSYWWYGQPYVMRWATFPTLTKAQEALAAHQLKTHNTKNFSKKV
jgi:hypothetical protein